MNNQNLLEQLEQLEQHSHESYYEIRKMIRDIIIKTNSCTLLTGNEFFETKIDIYTIVSQIYKKIQDYLLQY